MNFLWNKGSVFLLCVLLQFQFEVSLYMVLPLLLCLGCSLSHDLLRQPALYVLYVGYGILCFAYPVFLCYLPLMLYDLYQRKIWYVLLPLVLPFVYHLFMEMTMVHLYILIVSGIAIVLKEQQLRTASLLGMYRVQRDATREVTLLLEEKHQNLMVQQNYEIQVATLHERNRIAREIHDNVGHLLSSSLLQIGALQTIHKDESIQASLSSLRSTLSTAMDAVRSSVHDLHEDAIQLDIEIQKLIKDFTFCKVQFQYTIDHPPAKDLKYHILAIVKEGLHNVMKHSNATLVNLTLREQPRFYQLIIEDNGTVKTNHTDGIGLQNIAQRVEHYHGYMNIQHEQGFRIFITIPKEAKV